MEKSPRKARRIAGTPDPVGVLATLRTAGLSEREAVVYTMLLKLGPSPVRAVAAAAGITRATGYEVLKGLIGKGLVSYFHRTRHQHFVAEPPEKLAALLESRAQELAEAQRALAAALPTLSTATPTRAGQPHVRFFEGAVGVRSILEDVLTTMRGEVDKLYRVYSSADVREHLYTGFRNFTARRVKLGVRVRTIAIGPGGKLYGLDERRWLTTDEHDFTYQILYAGTVATISLGENEQPVGALLEDPRIARTQRLVFDRLWDSLG